MKSFREQEFWREHSRTIIDVLEGAILAAILSWLFYDSIYGMLGLLPFIWFWHRERSAMRREKAQEQFRRMFREWILLLASSLSAGYSVENAMGQSLRELQLMFPSGGIMLDELREMLAKAENNQRPEILIQELARRHPMEEVKSFAEIFCAARRSGGSLNAIIRGTAAQMAGIMDTRREIKTVLAAKVYEQKIMSLMPSAVLLYIRLGSREFLDGMYHNAAGVAVMTICLGIYIAAYLLGKRMVQFEI